MIKYRGNTERRYFRAITRLWYHNSVMPASPIRETRMERIADDTSSLIHVTAQKRSKREERRRLKRQAFTWEGYNDPPRTKQRMANTKRLQERVWLPERNVEHLRLTHSISNAKHEFMHNLLVNPAEYERRLGDAYKHPQWGKLTFHSEIITPLDKERNPIPLAYQSYLKQCDTHFNALWNTLPYYLIEKNKGALIPKADDWIDPVNIYTILLEFRDTLRLIPDMFRIIKSLSRLSAKGVPDAWLWFSFGLLPTSSDFLNLCALIGTFNDKVKAWNKGGLKSKYKTLYADHNGRWDIDLKGLFWHYASYPVTGKLSETIDRPAVTSSVAKVVIKYNKLPIDNPMTFLINALGLNKPLAGIWEGLPFSWLVDYFINIGQMVEDFENKELLLPIEPIGGSLSYKTKLSTSSEVKVVWDYPRYVDHWARPDRKPLLVYPESTYSYTMFYNAELSWYRRTKISREYLVRLIGDYLTYKFKYHDGKGMNLRRHSYIGAIAASKILKI